MPIPQSVREALALPMIHHRTPEFDSILKRVLQRLPMVFGTQQPVMMLTSTGSGAMEAAISNTLSPGDEVLCIVSGKFGERWAEMAKRYGLRVLEHQVPWGQPVQPEELVPELKSHRNLKAVLCQVCETSTGTLHPIEKLSSTVREHSQALVMVDAITALGATPLPMDAWQLDVVVAGSQKAFMLPAGLSFISLSTRAWQRAEKATLPRYYFDLRLERDANRKGQSYFSSAVSMIRALDVVLGIFARASLATMQRRCSALAEATQAAAAELGLSLYSQAPSPSVTALNVPTGVDGAKWRDLLESEHGVVVMGGQDQLTGKILRIGHLGGIEDEDMRALVRALAQSLRTLGFATASPAAEERARTRLEHILSQGAHVDFRADH